ncbi:Transcription factor IIIB 90 kDa subunit [Geodia barretti]|uniref:Transcription factor IIIB 90 kDa subunit n=1 Tax=Geodia barretti TaxID=519541 RepID=A0AA35WDV6_GEOBA|nr:Transcription factor IIIB 90 kDa subunit [Geodia barretti]
MRLVARMKETGSTRSETCGLCGAALLVAARTAQLQQPSGRGRGPKGEALEGTIRKSLGTSRTTASSRLTIDEFLKIDLEQEHDPPSFNDAKKKSKQQTTSTQDRFGQ